MARGVPAVVAAATAGCLLLTALACIALLPHDGVTPRVVLVARQQKLAAAIDPNGPAPAAYDSRDLREGKPMPLGSRATPKDVDKVYKNVDTMVSGLEAEVSKLKKDFGKGTIVSIRMGSEGPEGPPGPVGPPGPQGPVAGYVFSFLYILGVPWWIACLSGIASVLSPLLSRF